MHPSQAASALHVGCLISPHQLVSSRPNSAVYCKIPKKRKKEWIKKINLKMGIWVQNVGHTNEGLHSGAVL